MTGKQLVLYQQHRDENHSRYAYLQLAGTDRIDQYCSDMHVLMQ